MNHLTEYEPLKSKDNEKIFGIGRPVCGRSHVRKCTSERYDTAGCGQRPISGDYTEVTLPADGDSPRGTGDVCQDGAYHLPLGGAVRGFGKQLDHSRESGRCGERDPCESDNRGVSGGNEFFRYLRGRKFLFIQCPVCA